MKRILLALAFLWHVSIGLFSQCAVKDIPIDCMTVVEDFSGFDGSGFSPNPSTGQLCSNQWAITGFDDPDMDFGETRTEGDYSRDVTDGGGARTGGIYAYDDGSNQALWIQPGGSDFTPGTLTYQICNNSGTTIENIEVRYDILVLNDQGRANSFNFSYSTDDTNYTELPELDYTSEEAADGLGLQNIPRATTIMGIHLIDGACLFLRWTGEDEGGGDSRDEFGLDNIFVCAAAANMDCSITNTNIQNAGCQNEDYIFEVAFDVMDGSGDYEVVNADDNSVLASGTASPITVTLANSTSTTAFNILVRDANDNACFSATVEVTPEDCDVPCQQALANINEFHYDDADGDDNEFVEIFIADPQAIDLSNYQIDLYTGNVGTSYASTTLDSTTPNTAPEGTYYVWEPTAIQNGSPDGIALSGPCGLIEFISYEGTFTAVGGPADGVESTDVGVEETSTTVEETSIQLIGGIWQVTEGFNTKGSENALPVLNCSITNVSIQNAACQGADYVFEVAFDVIDGSGSFEVLNADTDEVLASGTASPITVTLANNTSTTAFNILVRDANDNACFSATIEVTPEDCDVPCQQALANINEFHYNDLGIDDNEFVEVFIANPQPADLSVYTIELYNGSNEMGYDDISLDQTNASVDTNGTYYVWEPSSIQNGAPEGIALAGPCGLIDFISYGGTFTAIGGIADGVESMDVGVEESNATPEESSIQLVGGLWVATEAFNTKGRRNEIPVCSITNVSIQNAACVVPNYEFQVVFQVDNGSSNYEVFDVTNNRVLATGFQSPINVILRDNASTTPFDIVVRDVDNMACVSQAVEVMPEDCTPAGCAILNVLVGNAACQNLDYVFEVNFSAFNSSDTFNIIDASTGALLGTGASAPITIILANNTSTSPLSIIVQDALDNTCASNSFVVTPEDCTPLPPLICLVDNGDFVNVVVANETNSNNTGAWDANLEDYEFNAFNGDGVNGQVEYWLISPEFDFSNAENLSFNFEVFEDFDQTNLEVLWSADYAGQNDPNQATWMNLTTLVPPMQDGTDFTSSESLSLEILSGQASIYLAFLYKDDADYSRWRISNINVSSGITSIGEAMAVCLEKTPANDTVLVQIPYVGIDTNVVVLNTGAGIIGGDDPSVVENGTIEIRLLEGENWSIELISESGCSFMASGTAPLCEFCDPAEARINEFHYDNASSDENEFVEIFIADPQPSNLDQYQIDLYNGNGGASYASVTLDTLPVTRDRGGSYYVWEVSGIQNEQDGIALSCACELIEFLSYEGTFTATDGPAVGIESVDIGVAEGNGSSVDGSIQLIQDVWVVTPDFNTKGCENAATPDCAIRLIDLAISGCQGDEFVFDLAFKAFRSNNSFEIVRLSDNSILATSDTNFVNVRIPNSNDDRDFEIVIRDANNPSCQSDPILIDAENCVDVCDLTFLSSTKQLPLCKGNNNGVITLNVSSSVPVEYSIDGGQTFQDSPVFAGLTTGVYTFIVRTPRLEGCEIRPSIFLPDGPVLSLDRLIVRDEICPDAQDGIIEIYASLFNANLLYSIDGGATFSGNNIFTGLAPGNYTILVKAAQDDFCTQSFGTVSIAAGEDTEAPTFVCPDDVVIGTDAGNCAAIVNNIGVQNIVDNCDTAPSVAYEITGALNVGRTNGDASGTNFPEGISTVTYFVEDEAGNEATCSFDVTIIDDDAPTFSNCPNDIIIQNATEFYRNGGIVTWTPPTFSDNCTASNNLDIENNIAPGFMPDLGETTITYLATDEAGNSSLCSFSIIVQDIYILDPCFCLDNRSNGNDGQFAETIAVYSASGETWQITAVNGLFLPPAGAFPPAEGVAYPLVPYQVGDLLTENPIGSGIYTLNGLHLESVGYRITVSNGPTTLNTSNSCNFDLSCNDGIIMPDDGSAPKFYTIDCGEVTGFFDDGGTLAPYTDNSAQTDLLILCPDDPASQTLRISFNQFDLASGEQLTIYDGDNLAAPILGTANGGSSVSDAPGGGWVQASCENSSGCLTVEFERNGDRIKGAGWEAKITCEPRDTRFSCPTESTFIEVANNCNLVENIELPLPYIEFCGVQQMPVVAFNCDSIDFDIDLSNNQLLIPNLPIGQYNIRISDPIYPERFCEYEVRILPQNLVCNDVVNVSLLNECTVVLTPDLLLENPCPSEKVSYELFFSDPNIPIIGTTINGFPIADFSSFDCGTRVEVKIERSIQSGCGEPFVDACWGNLIIEDKIAPELMGTIDQDTIYCYQKSADFLNLLNTQANDLNAASITLNFETEVFIDAINDQFSVVDNCEAHLAVSEWQAVEFDCTTGAFTGLIDNADDPVWAIMEVEMGAEALFRSYFRTIRAIDKCGNVSNLGVQRILVAQPDIVSPLLEIELPCGADTDPNEIYRLWASGDPQFAHYATFLPNYDPTPLDANGDFDGFAGLDDTYFTDKSGDEIPAALTHENCGYAIDWSDSERIENCGESFKIFREWTVFNWCDGHLELIDIVPQVIKVGDIEDPKLEFLGIQALPTSYTDCTTDAKIIVEISDDCGGENRAYIDILNDGLREIEYELVNDEIIVSEFPIGDSLLFTIRLLDDCGNSSLFGPFGDVLKDNIPPVAICESFRTIALDQGCGAVVPAEVFDDGSYDNCGSVSFSVARMSDVGDFLADTEGDGLIDELDGDASAFQPTITFESADLEGCTGTVSVIFRVEDGSGNANFCMVEVEVADKFPPVCRNTTLNLVCQDPAVSDLSSLLLLEQTERNDSLTRLLNEGRFGGLDIVENCSDFEVVVRDLDFSEYSFDCSGGTIRYTYQATDACGNVSNVCQNEIVVDGDFHDWQMDFPRDAIVRCDDRFVNFRIPRPSDLEDILVTNNGCDRWEMNVSTERFDNAAEGCYQLVYTYQFINTCTWDSRNIEPAVVERPDSILDERFETMSLRYRDIYINDDTFIECGVTRDLDDCEIVLSPLGRDGINDIDDFCDDGDDSFTDFFLGCDGDFVLFENDDRPYSGDVEVIQAVSQQATKLGPDVILPYVSAQEYGNFIYRQVIRVYDITQPVVEVEDYPSVFCGGEEDPHGDLCTAAVAFQFEIEDACLPAEELNVSYQLLPFNGSAINDPFGTLEHLGAGEYRITGNYPIQAGGDTTRHTIILRVEDDCFNAIEVELPFTVVDCKAPTPKCIFGLSADLSEHGQVTLLTSDFNAGSFDFCTSQEDLLITFANPNVHPDSISRTFRCQNGEVGTVSVQIWVRDLAGNTAFCETFVNLTDNEGDCPSNENVAALAGVIQTETEARVEGVEVNLAGNSNASKGTDATGNFAFYNLEVGYDYSITPHKDDDPLNGVSTFDLVLISKHILGVELLDSPYKIIAADVNRSGSITTFDMVALRKLILGIDAHFESNTSWRFVAKDYVFQNPAQPLQEDFPELLTVNDLNNSKLQLDFVAVKIGDVNNSMQANGNVLEGRNSLSTHYFKVHPQQLEDDLYRLDLSSSHHELLGYQFTLNYDAERLALVNITEGVAKSNHWAQAKKGKLTLSWDGESESEQILSLYFRTKANFDFAEVLQLSSDITAAEVYLKNGGLRQPKLSFQTSALTNSLRYLAQNEPNPFDESTRIEFYLSQKERAQFTIRNLNGKIVYENIAIYEAGSNEIVLPRKLLPTGVLFYTLQVNGYSQTRRMVVL